MLRRRCKHFDKVYFEQSAYYHGAGTLDSQTITILYLWPEGTLGAKRFVYLAANQRELRRDGTAAEGADRHAWQSHNNRHAGRLPD